MIIAVPLEAPTAFTPEGLIAAVRAGRGLGVWTGLVLPAVGAMPGALSFEPGEHLG
jgi:hypothetical protein